MPAVARRRDAGHNGAVNGDEAHTGRVTPAPGWGARIVVTGVTGLVAEPLAVGLAADNEAHGTARFTNSAAGERLWRAGVRWVPVDLAAGHVRALPRDVEYVVHMAVSKTDDWDTDLAVS